MPPKVPPPVSPQVHNDMMKLKMEMVAARAEAEQKKKLQNNQMAAARAAAEEKKQMLMEQMVAARAAAEEKKQMLRDQVMAARAAAEEKKQMLKEEQMLKNELAAVGNEMLGDEPILGDEKFGLEGFTLDEPVLLDEQVFTFETGPEDSRTLPTDITTNGLADLTKFNTKRAELLSLNNELSFENAASTEFLTPNMQRMIGIDNGLTTNKRYSPMTNFFVDKDAVCTTDMGIEYRVARKFNDEIMPNYLKKFYPAPGSDPQNNVLDTKFPTHSYFPDMKDQYEASEIFKFLNLMPKGGVLHIHSGALMDIDWVLRNDKWGNASKDVGLTASLCNDYGFFVNFNTIHNENDIYIASKKSEKLFKSFKRGADYTNGLGSETTGVRNSTSYSRIDYIYTDSEGERWLDLSATDSLTKQPVYTEAIQKNIRRCLTLVGADDPRSLAAYDIPKIWQVFELVNARWSSLRDAGDEPGLLPSGYTWSAYLFAAGMKYLYDTKTQHIDIRLGFLANFAKLEEKNANGSDKYPVNSIERASEALIIQNGLVEKTRKKIKDYIDAMTLLDLELTRESVAEGGSTKNAKEFKIRFILSTPRLVPQNHADYHLTAAFMLKTGKTYLPANDQTINQLDSAKAIKLTDPSLNLWNSISRFGDKLNTLISGYDMIAEEDRNQKTDFYKTTFLKVNQLEINFGDVSLNAPNGRALSVMNYFFHDGESNWHTNYNVVDAVMLGTKRVGHGFNVDMRPGVVAKAIRDNICFEISPISNQILQYTPDIRCHYANGLFRQGLPMIISNDDPIMYGYNGLTYDFFAAAVSWNLSYKAIKRLAWSSIEYSSLSDEAKISAKKQFTTMFKSWFKKIAVKYSITNLTPVPQYVNKVEGDTYIPLNANILPSKAEYMRFCC